MSERMTNVEIEDILSSIRRLVSEEARPPLRRGDARHEAPSDPVPEPQSAPVAEPRAELRSRPAPPSPTAPRSASRLVLTPAERVDEGSALVLPLGARRGPAPATALEARIAELEAMLAVPRDGFEADEGDPFSGLDLSFALDPAEAPAPVADLPSFATVRHTRPAPFPPAQPEAGMPPHEAVPNLRHLRDPAPAPAPLADPVADLEPTEPAAEVPSPDPGPDWSDTAPDSAPDTDAGDPPIGADIAASEVIDEAMLRDIVRDILREELQGALGERITRNVRKLVRAEVSRALTNRAYD